MTELEEVAKYTNAPPHVLSYLNRQLHLEPNHPIAITRRLIESCFPGFKTHNTLPRGVTTRQNFDSLGFPADHPGRNRTDTYYLNEHNLLRTHTSAHQDDVFRENSSSGWLISADVFRRDAVDRSHYPVFHQMEGALLWDRATHGTDVSAAVWEDYERLPHQDVIVDGPMFPTHPDRNPIQHGHSQDEAEALVAHLQKSLELAFFRIFSEAKKAAIAAGDTSAASSEPLKMRWVEAYFPFTSPSYELEIWWQGEWLEVLGSGVVLQGLLKDANVPTQVGWAFGIGLERIAMLLFGIPDIRLFWSTDRRFLDQFIDNGPIRRFVPFSKHPECYKDVSFWTSKGGSSAGGGGAQVELHENDVMEIVRREGGDLVEDVRLVDEFEHPKTRRRSFCYRINYRSLERTLTNEEVNELHDKVIRAFVGELGVEIR
ncbi:MAG: hypothetical protein Q9159_004284 [Coniocarpon cinnabarinum]